MSLTALLLPLAAAALSGMAVAWATTGLVTRWLTRRAVLDRPNARSSHSRPTPRGGGIGLLAGATAGGAVVLAWVPGAEVRPAGLILGATLALAAVSFLDDLRGASPALRLAVQGAAVAVGLAALPADALVCQGWLPWGADRLVAGLAWLWFVNLFNFMDGIDGISGVEAACVAGGLALVGWLTGGLAPVGYALALAGAALGFLAWNWQPARVFLGDVGSVPTGFLLGWLLLGAAADGAWAAALILPAYYLADATLTLLRRLARGERIWEAHRSHAYQQAVQRGLSHAAVARQVLSTNLILVLLAWASTQLPPWLPLALAVLPVASLLKRLARG